tara:strand:- start:1355 stop:1735 length:381 start_codon:yes stop_codon:yes gene_type:complete
MYQYLIKPIAFCFSLMLLMSCQSQYSTYGVDKISKRTSDFDLCFPVNYQRLFNAPKIVRFNYVKEIKEEIIKRELDCNSRFEADKITHAEGDQHRHIEEMDLDRLNKEVIENKNICRNEPILTNCN